MIKRSVLTAVVILIGYHLLLPHLSRRFYQILGQQRGNFLREENYVADPRPSTNVIVGSSMAQTLNDNTLGPNYTKLTFPGNSVLTALELIKRSEKKPNLVLIETNACWKDADAELLHDAFDPWSVQLRQLSPIFSEEGRPANFLGGIVEACVRRSCQIGLSFFPKRHEVLALSTPQTDPGEPVVQLKDVNMAEWDRTPPADVLNRQTAQLATLVDGLNRRGCHCILFTMPMDNTLANLSGPRTWRIKMHEQFPPSQYDWLTFDSTHHYLTTDGVHLIPSEADRVTETLLDQVRHIVDGSDYRARRTVAVKWTE